MHSDHLANLALTIEVEHGERVAHNSLLLGTALGLSEPQLDLLYWSALLHDPCPERK